MELWDVLDKKGNKTGKTIIRGKRSLQRGEYHLVVHIWVSDSTGRFLIQRRADTKLLMPGEWAATGGAALAGETSASAAARELSEELGIRVRRRDLTLVRRLVRKSSINDIWHVVADVDESSLMLQEEEVAEVKWVSARTLSDMVQNGEFHNYGQEYFDIVMSLAAKERKDTFESI